MSKLRDVFRWIDDSREIVCTLQRDLTSRPALGPVNGGQGEHEKTAYLKEKLEELSPDFLAEIKAPDEKAQDGYRPNLMALWNGEAQGPKVWVLSHMDIVPPGDLSLWDGDPYLVRIEGERLIGRGVQDDQQGIVSSYLAVQAIKASGLRPKRPMGLCFLADEETGSRYGLEYVLNHHGDSFDPEDLIIVPDAGNDSGTMIEVAEKSMLWLKFTITGSQCHASTPEKGENSLVGAAKLILALDVIKEKFNLTDKLFKPATSTFAPTKMEGNVPNINTIPGRDVFYMDCRILPQYRIDEILSAIEGIAGDVAHSTGLLIRVDVVQRQDAAEPTPPDARVVRDLSKAIKAVSGLAGIPMGIGGGTVAALLRKAGLPAAVWMTAPDSAHQPNEHCLIGDILKDAKILSCLFLDAYETI